MTSRFEGELISCVTSDLNHSHSGRFIEVLSTPEYDSSFWEIKRFGLQNYSGVKTQNSGALASLTPESSHMESPGV